MKSQQLNELIVFLLRETGWSLEYIRALHPAEINALVSELKYQKALDQYAAAMNAAMVAASICTMLSGQSRYPKKYEPKDFVSEPPKREGAEMVKKNLALSSNPVVIKIEGQEYELAKFSIEIQTTFEEKYQKSLWLLIETGMIKPVIYLIYLLLSNRYPDITEDFLLNSVKSPEDIAKFAKATYSAIAAWSNKNGSSPS